MAKLNDRVWVNCYQTPNVVSWDFAGTQQTFAELQHPPGPVVPQQTLLAISHA